MSERPTVQKMKRRLVRRSGGGGRTAEVYTDRLGQFFEWLGQTPEKFIEGIETGTISATDTINDFLDSLHERGLAPSTMTGHVNAIKKLVEVNTDVAVNWKRVEKPKITRVEEDQVPTKAIIRQVLLHADPKERAIALVAASSGMRGDTLVKLTMRDLDLESEPDIGIVKVPSDKSKGQVKFVTFISPEAREALVAYLSMRGKLKPEDPLLAARLGGFYSEAGKLAKRWIAPLEKAGLGQRSGKWRDYRFHTLRKFFRTALEYGGVSKSYRERMLGHAGEYLDSAYFGPEFDKLKGEYRRAIPHLTVEELVGEERMGTLEGELAETKERLAEAMSAFETMKDATVGKLRRELEAGGVDTSRTPHEIAAEMGLVDAQPAQKVIGEGELVAHLSEGWRFVAQLNNGSGKIVVEK
ncbi:tyrosine-type recombinase/integrase [Candidatus Bathyarchaeota archaeon]|nr:tyrosine-type recombinase/integrase [Candidatus Bathyarchaeota archaeon]